MKREHIFNLNNDLVMKLATIKKDGKKDGKFENRHLTPNLTGPADVRSNELGIFLHTSY